MHTFNLSSSKLKLFFAALALNIALLGCEKDSQHSKPNRHTIDPLVVGRIAEDSLFRDYAYAMNPNYRQLILELNPVKSDQDTATNWRAVLLVERRAAAKWRKLQQQYGLQGDSVAAQYAAAAYKRFFEKRFGAASNKAMSQPGQSIKTAAISREARTESFKVIMSTSKAAKNLQVQENDCSGAVCIARPPDGYIFLPPVEGQCCPKAVKFFTQKQADFMWNPLKREFAERLNAYLYKNDYSDKAIDIAKAWVDYLILHLNASDGKAAKDKFWSWYDCVNSGFTDCPGPGSTGYTEYPLLNNITSGNGWSPFNKADLQVYYNGKYGRNGTENELGAEFERIFFSYVQATSALIPYKVERNITKFIGGRNTVPDFIGSAFVYIMDGTFVRTKEIIGATWFECKAAESGIYLSSNNDQVRGHIDNMATQFARQIADNRQYGFKPLLYLISTADVPFSTSIFSYAATKNILYVHSKASYKKSGTTWSFKF